MGQGYTKNSEMNEAHDFITSVIGYTSVMSKYGFSKKQENNGIGIVLSPTNEEDIKDWQMTEEGKKAVAFWADKEASVKNLLEYYITCLKDTSLGTMKGTNGVIYDVIDKKHVDYATFYPHESRMVKIGIYDYKNVKYSIDMDYLFSLKEEDKRLNYIKQSFLNHYLFLKTLYDKPVFEDKMRDFLDIKPFFNFEIPEEINLGISWPLTDDYIDKGLIEESGANSYLDVEKFLKDDDDTILLCMVSDPNPDYPDYYEPEPEFVFPITRSYLRESYNPLKEDGTYKEEFTSITYRCAKDMEGIDDRLTSYTSMNQLYLLSPYFRISGGTQELYINTRDVMMLMYSTHKVFALRKEKEIPISAGLNVVDVGESMNVFGEDRDITSADHCQSGSNRPVFRVFMADIEEYTETVREEDDKQVTTITKEELYEKYPEVERIIETTQRCKDPMLLTEDQLEKEFFDNKILDEYYDSIEDMTESEREDGIIKLKKIYEKIKKNMKIMKLKLPPEVHARAQQEIENSDVVDMTLENKELCVYDEILKIIEEYLGWFENIDKIRELAEGPYTPFKDYEMKIKEFIKNNSVKTVDYEWLINDIKIYLTRFGIYQRPPNIPQYVINYFISTLVSTGKISDNNARKIIEVVQARDKNVLEITQIFITLVQSQYIVTPTFPVDLIVLYLQYIYRLTETIKIVNKWRMLNEREYNEENVFNGMMLTFTEKEFSIHEEDIDNALKLLLDDINELYLMPPGSEASDINKVMLDEIKEMLLKPFPEPITEENIRHIGGLRYLESIEEHYRLSEQYELDEDNLADVRQMLQWEDDTDNIIEFLENELSLTDPDSLEELFFKISYPFLDETEKLPINSLDDTINELNTLLDDYHRREGILLAMPVLPEHRWGSTPDIWLQLPSEDKIKEVLDEVRQLTFEEIKAKFSEFYNKSRDPRSVTSQFLELVKEFYGSMSTLTSTDTIDKQLYDIIRKYKDFGKTEDQVFVLEPENSPATPATPATPSNVAPPSLFQNRRGNRNQRMEPISQFLLEPELEE